MMDTTMTTKKKTKPAAAEWGGPRPGAGRKPQPETKKHTGVSINVRVSQDDNAAIREATEARGLTLTAAIVALPRLLADSDALARLVAKSRK